MVKKSGLIQGSKEENLLVLLKKAQRQYKYVPEECIAELAQSLNIPVSEVYGVATFYSFLSTRPLGRNIIRICQSLPCYLENSGMIIKSIVEELGIKPGETTPDGRFSFELTNCIGACDKAPAMLINDDVHGELTPGKISAILKSYQ